MSERNPVGFLDIRLVEEKLIDETILQDYRKVHEKLERLLDKVAGPIDEANLLAIEDQFHAWLFAHEARKDEEDRRTSLLRCGLGHIAVAIVSASSDAAQGDLVDRALDEFRRRGWDGRVFDAAAAEIAAKKYAPLEKKITPESPASNRHKQAAGKAGARQRIQKEGSAMSDVQNAGAAPATAESPAGAPKAKAPRKPRAAAPKAAAAKKLAAPKKAEAKKAPAKKAAAPKKAVAKKPAAKAVAKKPAVKKLAEKKSPAKKPVAAKAGAKKVAAKKPAAKAVAKKPAVKKAAEKKVVAKKPAAKPAAKKAVAAKKPAAKAAPKKSAAKKAPAKKAAK